MAHTNHTDNLELSQFLSSDKPSWLNDYNGDMLKIDAGVAAAASSASDAYTKAAAVEEGLGTLGGDVSGLSEEVGTLNQFKNSAEEDIIDLQSDVAAAVAYPTTGNPTTVTGWAAFGFMTSGNTEIDLFFPVTRNVSNSNALNVTALNVMLKGAEGNLYTGSSYKNLLQDPDVTVEASASGDSQVRIKLTNGSGFATGSGSNNRPVIAYGTITIEL